MPEDAFIPLLVKYLSKEQLWPILEAVTQEIGQNYGVCPLCGDEDVPVDAEGQEIEGDDVSGASEWRETHEPDCPVTRIERSLAQKG